MLKYTDRERREHQVFQQLLQMIPGLEGKLLEGCESNVNDIAELVSVFLDE